MTPFLVALFISTQAAQPAGAQTAGALNAGAHTAGAHTAAPPSLPVPSRPPLRIQAPILVQGTILASALGYVAPSTTHPGMMQFILEERTEGRTRRALTLLPSDPTDEVKAMLRSRDAATPWRFEVSGQVYDYQGRAYLLPSAIVALKNPPLPAFLSRDVPPSMAQEVVDVQAHGQPHGAPYLDAYLTPDNTPSPLRADSGALMEHERGLAVISSTDDAFAQELERRLAQGVRVSSTSKPADPDVDRSMILATATRLQDARATVTHDPLTGVWRASLESATKPGELLTMELLPCRELERVERAQRTSPLGNSWALSGEVVASGQRNYLLLSRARTMPNNRWIYP